MTQMGCEPLTMYCPSALTNRQDLASRKCHGYGCKRFFCDAINEAA
jgi:hypothetical protein